MRLSGPRFTMAITALMIGAGSVVFAIGGGDHLVAGAATSPTTTGVSAGPSQIVVQTMDSCKSGLGGAVYQLVTAAGTVVATAGSQGASSPGSVSGGSGCPVQQGDCVSSSKGCVVFGTVPPGDYRLRETAVPGPNSTNPDGYAACNGGSACRWESADVTVNPDGTIVAQVTNVAPNGLVEKFPNDPTHSQYYSGTPSDPIVFHDFGLAQPGTINGSTGLPNPQCDGDSDADDWSTGTPSSECNFPEAQEPVTCATPMFTTSAEGAQTSWKGADFPWQCLGNPVAAPLHLQEISLNGPSTVSALSDFFVSVSGGYTPTLVSAQDPGMSVTPLNGGFEVAMSPIRTPAGKHTPAGIGTGSVTITPQGGGGKLVVTVTQPSGNANFIENLYHDVLGRYGQPGEVGYWSSRIDGGETTGWVASTFSNTPEFLGHMVDSDYQYMVGVTPAPTDPGRQFWVNFLSQRNPYDAMTGQLGASDAYYTAAGGTDTGFITALYRQVLHRSAPPAPSELQYWLSFGPFAGEANAARRLQVANDFAYSHEQHMLIVSGWYTTFMGRQPDPAGQTYWADRMDAGFLPQDLVASFTNTPEYYALPAKY
jgi:hypothetical protein